MTLGTVGSAKFWTWTALSLWWRTFFVSLGDVLVRGDGSGCRIICLVGPGLSMMLGTNSDIPVSIMGLVSTYLASFFLFCKLPFKWYLAIFVPCPKQGALESKRANVARADSGLGVRGCQVTLHRGPAGLI